MHVGSLFTTFFRNPLLSVNVGRNVYMIILLIVNINQRQLPLQSFFKPTYSIVSKFQCYRVQKKKLFVQSYMCGFILTSRYQLHNWNLPLRVPEIRVSNSLRYPITRHCDVIVSSSAAKRILCTDGIRNRRGSQSVKSFTKQKSRPSRNNQNDGLLFISHH